MGDKGLERRDILIIRIALWANGTDHIVKYVWGLDPNMLTTTFAPLALNADRNHCTSGASTPLCSTPHVSEALNDGRMKLTTLLEMDSVESQTDFIRAWSKDVKTRVDALLLTLELPMAILFHEESLLIVSLPKIYL